MHSSKVYTRLKENVGIENYLGLLNAIFVKVAYNFKVRVMSRGMDPFNQA